MDDDPSAGTAAGGSSGSGRSRRTGGSSARRPSDLRRQRRRGSRRHSLRSTQNGLAGRVPPERTSIVMRKARSALTKKLQFFTELMKHLDMLVYAELCTLYYMECSFFRFVLRAAAQSFFLSPKPDDFLLVTLAHRPHVLAVVLPNVLCLLLHIFAPLPQASEASRGYLHGGIIVDFIGQKAPSSRYGLVLLDFVVLAVQCLMLAVHTEREKLRKLVVPLRTSGAAAGTAALAVATLAAAAAAAAATTPGTTAAADNAPRPLGTTPTPASTTSAENADSMERGEYRPRLPPTAESNAVDWIEMESLSSRTRDGSRGSSGGGADNGNGDGNGDGNDDGRDGRDGEAAADPEAAADSVLDALNSGRNLSDFYIIHAIRTASRDHQGAAAQSLQSLGYAVTLARLAAQRGARTAGTPQ